MKKKSTLFLIICAILVLGVALSACSLVQTNETRQANRVLATVTVDLAKEFGNGVKVLGDDWDYVVSLDVTRRELVATVNYAINYYSSLYSQYGLTYDYDLENMLESGLTTMKTQKYNAICAMGKLLADSATTGRLGAMYCETAEYQAIYGKTLVPEGVLTQAERFGAVQGVNDTFESRLEGYLDKSEDEERDQAKSEADDQLSSYYKQGYFVDSVSMAYLTDEKTYADGLYTDKVVDDGDSDTSDIDYKKLYVKVKMTKKDADPVYVYVPADSTALKTEDDSSASALPKYQTAKVATVSFSGRVYAEVTEEDDSGYTVESFTSDKEKYTLYTPRSAASASDEETDETEELVKALRYTKGTEWAKADTEWTQEMKDLHASIFSVDTAKMTDEEIDALVKKYFTVQENEDTTKKVKSLKDAYRQIKSYFESANVGFLTEVPSEKEVAEYRNYTYYNGLQYYYNSQFESYILTVLQDELSVGVNAEASEAEIQAKYDTLVLKDKANYEYMSDEEQVAKFFDTLHNTEANGLENAYYVPIEALMNTSFEVDPTDKRYEALFTFDDDGNVTGHSALVTEENGKYTMKYAVKNGDNTYTIHMVYTTHVFLSFDNVVGLLDEYKEAARDYSDEQKEVFLKAFEENIKTAPQLTTYLENYKKGETYELSDVYALDENGNVVTKTFDEVRAEAEQFLTEAYESGKFEDLLAAVITLTEQYNDDSGKLTKSGYLVSAGDMANNWMKDFTATTLETYFKHLVAGEDPTGDGNDLDTMIGEAHSDNAFASTNPYAGYHMMFLCFAPLYEVNLEANGGVGLQEAINIDGDTRWESIGKENTIHSVK